MNTPHEQPVDNGSALPPPPPQSALQDPGPESPPPVGMQAASFKDALAQFVRRSANTHCPLSNARAFRLADAMTEDMRAERRRDDAVRLWP